MKELGPSSELRTWFAHDPKQWAEFVRRFHKELEGKQELVAELRKLARGGTVTLLFAARDVEHNNAVALLNYIRGRQVGSDSPVP